LRKHLGTLDASRLTATFAGFELLDFYNGRVLQEKVKVTPHVNLTVLRESITREWDQL
jgi:hypothetical protein